MRSNNDAVQTIVSGQTAQQNGPPITSGIVVPINNPEELEGATSDSQSGDQMKYDMIHLVYQGLNQSWDVYLWLI